VLVVGYAVVTNRMSVDDGAKIIAGVAATYLIGVSIEDHGVAIGQGTANAPPPIANTGTLTSTVNQAPPKEG
jgi:hypothetical protein